MTIEEVPAETFFHYMGSARAANRNIRHRTHRFSIPEYRARFKCYLIYRKLHVNRDPEPIMAGFAIDTATAELCSVFNATIWKVGHLLIDKAVQYGAKRLSCLDGWLVGLYEKHGFVVTCSVEHKRGPTYPDIVYMCHVSHPCGKAALSATCQK